MLSPIVPATDAVVAVASSPGARVKSNVVATAITSALRPTVTQRCLVRIGSSFGRGVRDITELPPWSTPNAIAGGPSMMMFTHKIAIAVNGLRSMIPVTEQARNTIAKPSVVLNWKRTNFTMLS